MESVDKRHLEEEEEGEEVRKGRGRTRERGKVSKA